MSTAFIQKRYIQVHPMIFFSFVYLLTYRLNISHRQFHVRNQLIDIHSFQDTIGGNQRKRARTLATQLVFTRAGESKHVTKVGIIVADLALS